MKTFEEWWKYFRVKYPTATEKCCASMAWAARDEDFAALEHQLSPSPCGVAGHRRADCTFRRLGLSEIPGSLLNDGITEVEVYTCLACHREQEIQAGGEGANMRTL